MTVLEELLLLKLTVLEEDDKFAELCRSELELLFLLLLDSSWLSPLWMTALEKDETADELAESSAGSETLVPLSSPQATNKTRNARIKTVFFICN